MRLALPVALVTAAQLLGAQSPAVPADAQVAARADEYFTRLEKLGFTGGVLVRREGRTLFMKSYGFANKAANLRADTSTVYNIGSITKQFTAAAILKLEEQGRLRTTDTIGRFFPAAPTDKRGITLHQLLTHTAGFRSDYSPSDYETTTRDEYIRRMFEAPLRSKPGSTHLYSNAGYSMLAAIVELVTGRDYETALRELVLRPAGMNETGYKAPLWNPARVAHGYQNGRDWGTIIERIAPAGAPYWALRGNGGLHTTLADFARWDAAQEDGRVLTDSSRRKYTTGYVNEGPDASSQYAYGWAVMKTKRGTRLVTHNGGNGVYVAEFLRFVDEHVTLFVTSTVSELTATSAVRDLSRIVFGEPYEMPPERVAVSPALAESVVGTYRLADSSRLVLRVADGKLLAEAVGQQAYSLITNGDTTAGGSVATFNQRARLIVDSLVRGNFNPLVAALAPGGPDRAEVARQEAGLMQGRVERFGAFESIEVIGTVRGPLGEAQTTVRLNFARGGATNVYAWNREGRIMDIGARPYQPVELVGESAVGLRTLNVRGGPGARFDVMGGVLRALTPRGPLTLTRVK